MFVHFPHTIFLQYIQQLVLLFFLQKPTWQLFRTPDVEGDRNEASDLWQMFSLFSPANPSAKQNINSFLDIFGLAHSLYNIYTFVTTGTLQIRWTDDGGKDVAALGDNVYRRSA